MRRAPPVPPDFGGVRFPGDVVAIEPAGGSEPAAPRPRRPRVKDGLFGELPKVRKPGGPEPADGAEQEDRDA